MTVTRRLRTATAATALLLAGAGLTAGTVETASAAAGCRSTVPGDVNGDGHAEVAIGASAAPDNFSGAVHVLYGRRGGLVADAAGTALDDQYFAQSTPGVPGDPSTFGEIDSFGDAVQFGDFNADGCADLAIGAPGETKTAGSVTVLYGSPRGLTTSGARVFTTTSLFGAGQSETCVEDPVSLPEEDPIYHCESFGRSLAVGDLDGDGVDDLAVGAPEKDLGGQPYVGAVAVLFGDRAGLDQGATPAALVTRDTAGVPGVATGYDNFGTALTTGDFDDNGRDELAVGFRGVDGAGLVEIIGGTATGFGSISGTEITQDTAGVPGAAEPDDEFGTALAAGDVTGDGRADLVVGVPGEQSGEAHGSVVLLKGSADGLTGSGSQRWTTRSPGVAGSAGGFGSGLTIGPLDADRYADLAVTAIGGASGSGSVTLLRGSATGLTTAGAGGRRFDQNTPGIPGTPQRHEGFGAATATAYVQSGRQASLIIAAPFRKVHGKTTAGLVHQLAISPDGPDARRTRTFDPDSPGVKGKVVNQYVFGASVG